MEWKLNQIQAWNSTLHLQTDKEMRNRKSRKDKFCDSLYCIKKNKIKK